MSSKEKDMTNNQPIQISKEEKKKILYIGNESKEEIFGDEFVENNIDNIELEINGIKYNLIEKINLKKGENKVKMKIKNNITNLEKMFYYCKSLKNIERLEYLYTKEIICSSDAHHYQK